MELRQLRSFVAVAEELHFSRAAERLHIAQPALSQQIRRLEHELGAVLFERTTRRVELTGAGRVLLERARSLLAAAERSVADTRRAARGELGWLTIGFVDSAAYGVLPAVLRALRRAAPGLALELRELSTEAQLAGLRDDIDVGIVRDVTAVDGLTVTPLVTEPLLAATPTSHRLAARDAVRLAELARDRFVMFPRDHVPTIHDRLVDLCQRVGGFRPTVGVDALQYPTMLGLVAAGYGVALVPASMRRLRLDGVGFLPLREAQLDTRLAIAHRVGDRAPQVARFVGLARSAVAGSHLLDVP